MKRISIVTLCIFATIALIAFAYIRGHRHGVSQAHIDGLAYEILIYDRFSKEKPDEARDLLSHLIAHRFRWMEADIGTIESWMYWMNVDDRGKYKEIRPRVEEIYNTAEKLLMDEEKESNAQ